MKKILTVNELKPYLEEYISFEMVRNRLLENFDEFEWLSFDNQKGMAALSRNGEIVLLEGADKKSLLQALVDYEAKKGHGKLIKRALDDEKQFYIDFGFESVQDEDEYDFLEYPLANTWLGKQVTVQIDQPAGMVHPYLEDTIYRVPMGYIYDAQSMEEPIDAYVIGDKEDKDTFFGVVVAVIYHERSDVATLVVGRIGEVIQKEEILKDIAFREQYFSSRIVWKSK
ncbi:hypothetical protein [Bulleidia sp. zg-1006]|uniref:hypothetical protein n=1 Tax=Bulleidia sp. zg-1006 TaxID=2806552 RepID=UPI001939D8D7|nr:hypothetical protein [Bulleidia sp. zg-1006]QRG87082.1 hypothetical protein JOS54_01885 [Bulleidia sp. zg-1006]